MIKPARGYILILPDKAEDKTASGLYISEKGQEKPMKGTVMGVGAASIRQESLNYDIREDLSAGSTVYYKRWGTEDIKEDGKEYVIVRFEDILAVVE